MGVAGVSDNSRTEQNQEVERRRFARSGLDSRETADQEDIDSPYSKPEDSSRQTDFSVEDEDNSNSDSETNKSESVLGKPDIFFAYEAEKYGEIAGQLGVFEEMIGRMKQRELEFRDIEVDHSQFNESSVSLGVSDLVRLRMPKVDQSMRKEINDYALDLSKIAQEILVKYGKLIDKGLRRRVVEEINYFSEGAKADGEMLRSDSIVLSLKEKILNLNVRENVGRIKEDRAHRLFMEEFIARRKAENEAGSNESMPPIPDPGVDSSLDAGEDDTNKTKEKTESLVTDAAPVPSLDTVDLESLKDDKEIHIVEDGNVTDAAENSLDESSQNKFQERLATNKFADDKTDQIDSLPASSGPEPELSTDEIRLSAEPLNWQEKKLQIESDSIMPEKEKSLEAEADPQSLQAEAKDQSHPAKSDFFPEDREGRGVFSSLKNFLGRKDTVDSLAAKQLQDSVLASRQGGMNKFSAEPEDLSKN